MKRLAIGGSIIFSLVVGAIALFIREPYVQLSAFIAAAPPSLEPPILRAAMIAAEAPRDDMDATFTDQLVKYADTSQRRTLTRIAQSVAVRVALDARFTNEQILSAYAERVYLGENVFGVRDAAQHYFRKTPSQLTIAECALLAGLVRSPSRYSPSRAPQRAIDRRNDVLTRMRRDGVISDQALELARKEPLRGRG